MSAEQKTALVMAGGTGGHVFPALATAQLLQQQGVHVEWLGTARGIEAEVVPNAGIKLHCIEVSGLRGKGKLSLLLAPFKLVLALWQAIGVLRRVKPDVVLGMGGFASGPGGLAAWLLRRPLVIQEQNAIAGLTNRILARFADTVAEAFGGAFKGRDTVVTGNPVRGPILDLPVPAERAAQRQGPLRLLVVGGSLGAKAINDLLPAALAELPKEQRPEVWHQTGKRNFDTTQALYTAHRVDARVVPFIEDMAEAYGWADLVLCRAGALTVSELMIAGVAAVLVPLPHAVDDHQTANASYLAEAGAAVRVAQAELNEQKLKQLLAELADREKLLAMAGQARQLAKPEAGRQVAALCLEAMKR
ncbi:undecaprenyldiphospho-muramoylpentapeptide beta-N-acetylglucosaminyltransferase [Marinobacterium arenosum]|uniref:undecaprenyldiphospho-muramoylpentapeptide beta-N-acetylglucosaminyltransferase n=1 Tax=Marinobacterium arenosum TaxID=2862496 RepID=UPI001C9806CF|nr:undecaprenyldiphospho-muramoylpentapeptide beta-N-acetylglucosaminyltransferase [Marinobacterium arenosum]MBY4676598.1 undecaprenyldiphospho-muramoylpentapeptide beta-N-acetylglucosaminyltransferase [Marinobacterium arenosum]